MTLQINAWKFAQSILIIMAKILMMVIENVLATVQLIITMLILWQGLACSNVMFNKDILVMIVIKDVIKTAQMVGEILWLLNAWELALSFPSKCLVIT